MTNSSIIQENQLIKLLDDIGEKSFLSKLQLVKLNQGEIIFEKGNVLSYSYFPTTAVISLVFESSDNSWLEMEAIRNDGIFGHPLIMDSLLSSHAIVQSSGYAYKIKTSVLKEEAIKSENLFMNLLKYQQLRMEKISQMSVCTRFHSIEQQVCRILLDTLDHSFTDTVEITHQTIANKLNVRRESISFCVANLHREGLLRSLRGKIIVLDRKAIEGKVCECYKVIVDATKAMYSPNHKKTYHIEQQHLKPEFKNLSQVQED